MKQLAKGPAVPILPLVLLRLLDYIQAVQKDERVTIDKEEKRNLQIYTP